MALKPGSFWKFSPGIQSKIDNLCEEIKSHNDNQIGYDWYLMCVRHNEKSLVKKNKNDEIEDKIKDILRQISCKDIKDQFGDEEFDAETQNMLCILLEKKLKKEDVLDLAKALQSWRESLLTDGVFQLILLPKVMDYSIQLSSLRDLVQIHPKSMSNLLRSLFCDGFSDVDEFALVFEAFGEEEKSSFIQNVTQISFSEDHIALLDVLLPHLPISLLSTLSESFQTVDLADSLLFSKFLSRLLRMFLKSMSVETRQNLLIICKNNRTLLKRQLINLLTTD